MANISFGQGIAVTPLQMVRAFSAVANGGFLVKPHIVQKITAPHDPGRPVFEQTLDRKEVLKPGLVETMTGMLRKVVEPEGTAARAAVPGYAVAGKTGTSQKLVGPPQGPKVYSNEDLIVSFAGFVPAQDPAFVLLVIYDEPEGDVSGGLTAAPSFQRIASSALGILGVKPIQQTSVRRLEGDIPQAFVGKSFQEVLTEIKSWDEEQRSRVELYGFGRAVREEVKDNQIRIYFE